MTPEEEQARAEERAKVDTEMRRLLWTGHGHYGLYGDDGEMQCSQCFRDRQTWDYKYAPLDALLNSVIHAREEQARAAIVARLEARVAKLRLEVAACGPVLGVAQSAAYWVVRAKLSEAERCLEAARGGKP